MQNKKLITWIISLVVLLGITLVFSGTLKTTKKTSNVIKIYSSVPMSGMSSGKEVYNGAAMAFAETGYKVGDFTIEFIAKDDGDATGQWLPELENKIATEAAADPDVMVYMGTYNSGAAKVSIPITNKAGIAQISVSNTWPGLTQPGFLEGEPGVFYPSGKRTFFRTCPTDAMQGPAEALWAKELGFKSVYVVDDSDAYGIGVASLFTKKAEEIGIKVFAHESITSKDVAHIKKIVTKIKVANPDLVYYGGMTVGGVVTLVKEMRANKITAKVMGADGIYEPVFVEQLGKDAENIYISSPGVPVKNMPEAGKEIAKKYRAKYGVDPDINAVTSYEAAQIVITAIERAGVKDRNIILNEIAKTNYSGVFGPTSFDSNGDTTLPVLSGNVIKDGVFEFVKILPN
jgi:branched-chain amino acid transport system substrate-binding protein